MVLLGSCCFEVASLGRREDLANVMLLLAAEKTTLLLRYVDFPFFCCHRIVMMLSFLEAFRKTEMISFVSNLLPEDTYLAAHTGAT